MANKDWRALEFANYGEVVDEIERLEQQGYRQTGNWNLSQVCEHLNWLMAQSLDGFSVKVSWLVRVMIGRPMLFRAMKTGRMPKKLPTLPEAIPKSEPDDQSKIAAAKESLCRLQQATELHPSPLAGKLTLEQWERLHCVHAAHHLGFLVPEA
ncbi:DUF1569 domain-containing protein [Calycomorphotria hydatis]|uniref:DUF1569 domain-containing protein n=1 Tax=Calycomorphotria hydatis TaxID=2528027 RepID=A0A517T487_9PLAN|nr:DUF1569 domain-containing protein [Calycomorphotria hydatis]QDT63193.1 hypothetical protein V22_04110 [Calycomorphotria hydatis]